MQDFKNSIRIFGKQTFFTRLKNLLEQYFLCYHVHKIIMRGLFMNKKFLSLALCLIFTCACNNSSNKSISSSDAINVDILQYKVEFKDQFEALADIYNEQNPDVHINVMSIGGGSDYNSVLKSKLASSNQPAIFNIGGLQDTKDYMSMLVDLKNTKAAQNALKGTLDGVSMNDKVYGLPYNVEGYGLIYNKDIFAKAKKS
jgi:ABC-type sugar transport system, periplasmic component